jgi:hypothetical protein
MASPMHEPNPTPARPSSVLARLAWKRLRGSRPLSFFLLPAMLVVVLLGVQVVHYREAPLRMAVFLGLNLLFFFGVMAIALVECFEVLRSAFTEERRIYRQTLGDEAFARKLGREVAMGRGAPR